jgi:hypothetical protein
MLSNVSGATEQVRFFPSPSLAAALRPSSTAGCWLLAMQVDAKNCTAPIAVQNRDAVGAADVGVRVVTVVLLNVCTLVLLLLKRPFSPRLAPSLPTFGCREFELVVVVDPRRARHPAGGTRGQGSTPNQDRRSGSKAVKPRSGGCCRNGGNQTEKGTNTSRSTWTRFKW